MKNKILTFIIPIYNGEKFLNKCIDSILNSGFSENDIEVLCIDDCSHDNSRNILFDYEKKYSNIRAIYLERNHKTGTVCNIGLEKAKGEYIWIIGQDDFISENSFSILNPILISEKPDVLAFNYSRIDYKENEIYSKEVFTNSSMMSGTEYIRRKYGDSFRYYFLGWEWRAVFRLNYLKEKSINFPNDVVYEDTTFLLKSILNTNKFKAINNILYFYRLNDNSITYKNLKHKGSLVYEFSFKAGNEVLDFANSIKLSHPDFFKILLDVANKRYFNSFSYKIVSTSLYEKKIFYNCVKLNKPDLDNAYKYLNLISRILINKNYGFYFSVLLMPFYKTIKHVKNLFN